MEWVPAPVATLAAWILTLTFAWATVAKFVRGNEWPSAVTRFGFRGWAAQIIVFAVPLAETTVVVLFLVGALRPAAAFTLALVAMFSAAIVRVRMVEGGRVPCGCFGKSHERDYRLLLARNGALALLAAAGLMGPRGASLRPSSEVEVVPLVLAVVGLFLVAWVTVQSSSSFRRR